MQKRGYRVRNTYKKTGLETNMPNKIYAVERGFLES